MLIAELFTIATMWKQPKSPSADEWVTKMWSVCVCIYIYVYIYVCVCMHTHTMEYYSVIKKNENFAVCNNMDGPRGFYA